LGPRGASARLIDAVPVGKQTSGPASHHNMR
jgi:hypothetical protein